MLKGKLYLHSNIIMHLKNWQIDTRRHPCSTSTCTLWNVWSFTVLLKSSEKFSRLNQQVVMYRKRYISFFL